MNRIQTVILISLFLIQFKTGLAKHRIIISSDFPTEFRERADWCVK
jgi:hypothetical protein